ncbi:MULTISPECIES: YccF domain-containing protein [unclassified Frankia]|uniref:YccF domain-containing protein n=1 Tax=unclassified Frankia TaxID=2632575 RepID=UPI002AD3CAE3|nr:MULTISPECIES: YccF domain-containing protein [unclassified Frankia]
MRIIGNILWLLFAGFELALGYLLAGIVCCLLIVTIPFGVAAFRLAGYVVWPFGRVVVDQPGEAPVVLFLVNLLWFLIAGWWLVLGHLIFGVVLCLTIIGIPFGVASFKMIPLAIAPLGRRVVPLQNLDPAIPVAASVYR